MFFFFKRKTAYELRISDWSSDVCSSDLAAVGRAAVVGGVPDRQAGHAADGNPGGTGGAAAQAGRQHRARGVQHGAGRIVHFASEHDAARAEGLGVRSEEHTSELQSLMRISYAVFCLTKNRRSPAITLLFLIRHTEGDI